MSAEQQTNQTKPKRQGFKWGQELLKWKIAHSELKKAYEDLVSKTLEENEGFLGEVRKSGYKDGWSDGCMETEEKLRKEFEERIQELEFDKSELRLENREWDRQLAECELIPSENVLCSYDDIDDFISLRVKDICREENLDVDANMIMREFKELSELQEENVQLRLEVENLKTELAGDDARMDKMEQERIQEVQKLRAEIAILQGVSKNGKLKRVNPSK
jgi:regulator of replication initiation timing